MKGQNFEIIKNLDGFANQRKIYKNFLFNKYKDLMSICVSIVDPIDDDILEDLFNDWIVVSELPIKIKEIHHRHNLRKEYREMNPDIGLAFFVAQPVSKLELMTEVLIDACSHYTECGE